MPLSVKQQSQAQNTHENAQFRRIASNLIPLFDKMGWDGLLIANPSTELQKRFQPDAILLYTKGIILVDLKDYEGDITLPEDDEQFVNDKWFINNKGEIAEIAGGSYSNPFDQLKTYRESFYKIVEKSSINHLLNVSRVGILNIFRGPITLSRSTPGKFRYYDLIDENNLGNFLVDYTSPNSYSKSIAKSLEELFPSEPWHAHIAVFVPVGPNLVKSRIPQYTEFIFIVVNGNLDTGRRIYELKYILNKIASDYTDGLSMQFSGLFARLDFIFKQENIGQKTRIQIGQFRYKTKKNSPDSETISESEFFGYAYSILELIATIGNVPLPEWSEPLLKKVKFTESVIAKAKEWYPSVIGTVWDKTPDYFIVSTENQQQFKFNLTQEGIDEYAETIRAIQPDTKVCALDVKVDVRGECTFVHLVFEPDYLVDISAIANCVKNIGGNTLMTWQSYFIGRFLERENTPALLLGNVANFFLDKLVYSPRENTPVFLDAFKETFQQNPIEYSHLFKDNRALKEFAEKANIHYDNLKRVVTIDMSQGPDGINFDNVILEPAFISEKTGMQGRMDLLDLNNGKAKILELKSGKLPFPADDPTRVDDSHAAQARMYRMLLKFGLGYKENDVKTDICYSSATEEGQNIRSVPSFIAFDKGIINLRNMVVHSEFHIASSEGQEEVDAFVKELNFDKLSIELKPTLQWLRKDWDTVQETLGRLDETERSYFIGFYRFIVQELILSKIGDGNWSLGQSALWNKDDESQANESNVLDDLKISENSTDAEVNPSLILHYVRKSEFETFNFRKGDICVLYKKQSSGDTATSGQIFKCSILEEIDNAGFLKVVFRYRQNSKAKDFVFDRNASWSLEHDVLDHSYNGMFVGLFNFAKTNKTKRELILGRREPARRDIEFREYVSEEESFNHEARIQQNRILNSALSAEDYFLLVGPPGTGKTRVMLKHLVRRIYHSEPSENILLLAYTNSAVDEICETINNTIINLDDLNGSSAKPNTKPRNFIRIGSRLGCAEEHHHNLLDVIASKSSSRADLLEVLSNHRIFISTVSSISSKPELFKLKKFSTVIIDEASQILEPQIVGLLAHFNKFILIGDHKQLPAVSLQSIAKSKRFDDSLAAEIGMMDLRESYFERLLRLCKRNKWTHAFGELTFQGRMHPEVAIFPNHCFYNNKLVPVGLTHQVGHLPIPEYDNGIQAFLAKRRLLFVPSKETEGANSKANEFEAKAVATLVHELLMLRSKNSGRTPIDSHDTVAGGQNFSIADIGVITPYRNQISHIKKELELQKVANWEKLTVDTVERFQGSQRKVIILSLCINSAVQLEFLASNAILDEHNRIVDRKLNVALTRAKEQTIILGNPYWLSTSPIYYRLMHFYKSRGGLIAGGVDDVINGTVEFRENEQIIEETRDEILVPEETLMRVFNSSVLNPIRDRSPEYPRIILGHDSDYNRNVVLEYGRADFDQSLLDVSAQDRVALYCYYNMRKHYFSQLTIFKMLVNSVETQLLNSSKRMVCIDWGCGPATTAVALQSFLKGTEITPMVDYFGIDISGQMLMKAREFLNSEIFGANFSFTLAKYLDEIDERRLSAALSDAKYCIFNFSYFFGNIDAVQARQLASSINRLVQLYPLNKYYILFQNTSMEKRNHSYRFFKQALSKFEEIVSRTEMIDYSNQGNTQSTSSENVYFELLGM